MQRTHDYRLRPSQLFIAAVGMFTVARNFEFVVAISSGELQLESTQHQLAHVYKDKTNGRLHIIYHPGKDNTSQKMLNGNYTHPLKSIREKVDEELATKYRHVELDHAVKHFIVGLQNKTERAKSQVEHYVYATLTDDQLTVEDSMDRILTKYDESGLQEAITDRPIISKNNPHPENGVSYTYNRRGWQLAIQSWQCGDYALEAMSRNIRNQPQKKPTIQKESKVIATHDDWYRSGKSVISKSNQINPHYESFPDNVHESHSQDTEEQVASDDATEPSSIGKTINPPFFSRPWVRNLSIALILIGAGILAAGITTLTGGFGAVLTPLIFGLAIGGCVAGGLLAVSGGIGMVGRLRKFFSRNSQSSAFDKPQSNLFGSSRRVFEKTGGAVIEDGSRKQAENEFDYDGWVDVTGTEPTTEPRASDTSTDNQPNSRSSLKK